MNKDTWEGQRSASMVMDRACGVVVFAPSRWRMADDRGRTGELLARVHGPQPARHAQGLTLTPKSGREMAMPFLWEVMTGNITRAIALVAYGNAFLRKGFDISGFTLEHPVFQFENKVDFRGVKHGWFGRKKEVVLAEDPIHWLRHLKQNGVQRLILDYTSDNTQAADHKLAGMVGGGGHWFIHSFDGRGSSVWAGREHVTRQNDPERRIWEVNYWLFKQLPKVDLRPSQLVEKTEQLRIALEAICEFSKEHAHGWWERNFKPAMDVLDDGTFDFQKEYVARSLPLAYYPERLQRLLTAASRAWVFGGMGSWNDIAFREEAVEQRYNEVSGQLFNAVNWSIVSAVNEPWSGEALA